jgi:outer membrane protein assembly factor BamB
MKRLVLFQMIAFLVLVNVDVFGDSADDYWPTWRGPNCRGISPEGNPPLTWSETENIKWKVKLTGDASNSSPIIWKDKIFFQTAIKTDVKGKPEAPSTGGGSRRRRGPGGSPPTNIYKFNLVCLDRNSGKMNTLMGFGEGGSLAVVGDAVIVVRDHEGDSFIVALNKETGEMIWKKDRNEATSWATPLPIEVNGKIQVVINATNLIRSYDLETGDIVWQCSGQTRNVVPTPVVGYGMIFCTSGFRGSALQAIELGRTGDLSDTDAVKWHVKEATPYVPSPLLYGDKLYVCSANQGVISCYNARTGKAYFLKERLQEINGIYASPAGAAGRVYFVGRNGVTYVLKQSEKFEVLAINTLDDKIDCSPAFIGNEMYIKGKENLYCLTGTN